MSKWQSVSLGEICEITGGNSAPQGTEPYEGGTVPFVRMRDLGRYHFTSNLDQTDDKLTETALQKYRMKVFEPGCLLFPRSGSVFLNHRAVLGIHACIVSHIGVMQNFKPSINVQFLYYYLQTFDMTRLSKKTTGVDSISFSDVARIRVPLPPLAEQERIVCLLDEAESLRKLRGQASARMEEFVPALFDEMFGNPETNELGWELKSIKDIGLVTTGNTPSTKKREYYGEEIEWIKSDNINTPSMILTPAKDYLSKEGKKVGRVVPAGSVLVTCIAGNSSTIGNAAIADREVAFNQQINAITPYEFIDAYFLHSQIMALREKIKGSSSGGMKGIVSKGTFEKISVIVPPIALQREFAQRVQEAREIGTRQAQSAERLEALYQSMLSRAFAGEL